MSYKDALDDFLKSEEITETALALKVGCSQAAINRYRNDARFPDADTARRIEEHTSGAVPFSLWQQDFLARSGISPSTSEAA